MKKIKTIFFLLLLVFFYPLYGIHSEIKKEEILKKNIEKHEDRNFNMYIDFISSIYSKVEKEVFDGGIFSEESLKLDLIGKANENIDYRFVKKINMYPESNRIDKKIMDIAYLKCKLNDQLSFLIGKQPISFGSMEYNSKYLQVYQYPDIYKNEDNPVGINFIYTPKKNQEFRFQIVNNLNKENNFFKKGRNPMGYSLNWNWNLFHKKIQNRWSYSIFQEKEPDHFWKVLALGSKLDLKPVSMESDYILSDEDIEKNGNLTKIFRSITKDYQDFASIKYGTYFLKVKYNFIPRWNLFAKGVYEIGRSKKEIKQIIVKDQLFKKGYTYYGGIEYQPIKHNEDLSLYFLYQRKYVKYMDKIKQENKNNHFISLGLSYRVKLL
ncbi:hypothetical protein DM815_01605 [Blattabacterium sp. (Cryptocercus kyebangensis)]|uniref:porin n=1 Tax=Blattabacterium sp. (Cryptocercus kyebangensis) TaxID=298656 RepID=UPI000D7BBA49|nr:porin [Blattabacterium sp. (Cryptocercus kyebangensis)]AWU43741.1 hypothetical protein DM815_01605 [Blattabacterium sp. (Cryptocercus kyebangensis)]